MNQHYSDLNRRVENLLCIGVISENDHHNNLCKATIGDISTNWLSVPQAVGHNYTQNNPIRIGTQVLLASISGDLSQAVIIAMLPSEQLHPPSAEHHLDVIKFNDGTVIKYDSEKKQLDINAVNKINVTCKNAVITATENIDATAEKNISITATENVMVHADGDIKATAGGDIHADASSIKLNKGMGVVTGAHVCQFTGSPHSDCSSTVTAGK